MPETIQEPFTVKKGSPAPEGGSLPQDQGYKGTAPKGDGEVSGHMNVV